MKTFALILLGLCTLPALGQTQKVKVRFTCQCDDLVGARYATVVRDLIAKSPRYVATSVFTSGTVEGKDLVWNYGIRVLSVDDGTTQKGIATAVSVVITIGDIYISQLVETCGSLHVDDCAADTLAFLDKNAAP